MSREIAEQIAAGKTTLGMEFGSTKIKAVLIDCKGRQIASGSFSWASSYRDGNWTYALEDAVAGMQACYRDLAQEVRERYGVGIKSLRSMGISGMMHGYLPFDDTGRQLTAFRTWQNTNTGQASEALTKLLSFPIPQRWSVCHLYQAILNREEHVKKIAFLKTLSGYIHWRLTGEKVIGIGEASGMFPIDSTKKGYDRQMLEKFRERTEAEGISWSLEELLPRVLTAGESAGYLTAEGALLMDPSGELVPGIPLCPPEGDAATGMAATNSVRPGTGNVSAGTSIFAMIVLQKKLAKLHPEIDLVTTPDGQPTAMIHCINCTRDLNDWISLLGEFSGLMGGSTDTDRMYEEFFRRALEGEADCGGIVSWNYVAGEHITGVDNGRPLLVRLPEGNFSLANFARAGIYSAFATLKLGLDILLREGVPVEQLVGHGGLFRSGTAGQRFLAAATGAKVCTLPNASLGGAWGMALLASYMTKARNGVTLSDYLEGVHQGAERTVVNPDEADCRGFGRFLARYVAGLEMERMASRCL